MADRAHVHDVMHLGFGRWKTSEACETQCKKCNDRLWVGAVVQTSIVGTNGDLKHGRKGYSGGDGCIGGLLRECTVLGGRVLGGVASS